ncbi:MAG: hypothetical protein ACM3JD_16800, partial [Rudaea sp.]
MARVTLTKPLARRMAGRSEARLAPSLLFDGVIAALSAWFVGGVFIDGWAHQHVPSLETFFTPWHAILYSGFAAVAVVLAIRAGQNALLGYSFPRVVPAGYELSLLGVVLFMVGGVGDLIWHTLFGIEANVEALVSPTHLLLALGGILTVTGPLRAAWYRKDLPRTWAARLPMLLSVVYMLSLLAFFTQYAHPFGETLAARAHGTGFASTALGVTSILIQTALLMGFALLIVRRFWLPFGSLTLILGLDTTLMVMMRYGSILDNAISTGPVPLILVAVLAGLAGDILVAWLKPSAARPAAFRLFAFALPAILYALYFAALALFGGGIAWKIHLWAGAIVIAGIVGFLLSYAFVPPAGEWQEAEGE